MMSGRSWWVQPRINLLMIAGVLLSSPENKRSEHVLLCLDLLRRVLVAMFIAFISALAVGELQTSKRHSNKAKLAKVNTIGWSVETCSETRRNSKGGGRKEAAKKPQQKKKKKKKRKGKKGRKRHRKPAYSGCTQHAPRSQDALETAVDRPTDKREIERRDEQRRQAVARRCERVGVSTRRPWRPEMALAATRMKTFQTWPHRPSHPPRQMADAEFYYTGEHDLVQCFYCNSGLWRWNPDDDPWVEHARYFPHCLFVRQHGRFQLFVDAVRSLDALGGRSPISVPSIRREMARMFEAGNMSSWSEPAAVELESRNNGRGSPGPNPRCVICRQNRQEVVLPCGHKSICWVCFQCPSYLNQCRPYPLCYVCQGPIRTVFQDRTVQKNVSTYAKMRRIRSDYRGEGARGRCCVAHSGRGNVAHSHR